MYLIKQGEWKAQGGIQVGRMCLSLIAITSYIKLAVSLWGTAPGPPARFRDGAGTPCFYIYHERTSQTFLSLGLVLALIPCLVSEVKKHGV